LRADHLDQRLVWTLPFSLLLDAPNNLAPFPARRQGGGPGNSRS